MATDLERLSVLIEANTKSYERAMVRLQKQTDQAIRGAGKSIKGLNAQLAAATTTARTFASALGAGFLAGGLAQIPGAVRSMVKEVADLGDEADRVGLTAERLQELNFQAQQTGSSAATMADALNTFGKRISEAAQGSGDLAKLLAANGIELKNADGTLRPLNDLLTDFINLIGNAANEADALNIAAQGFGRGAGAEMALTFADGADASERFAAMAHRASLIISNELVKSAQDIDDQFDQLTGTISTMLKAGLLEFLQTTQKEIRGIGDAIDWVLSLGASVQGQPSPFNATPQEFEEFNKRSERINQAFEDIKDNAKLLEALQKKASVAPGGDESLGKPAPTILPPAPQRAAGRKAAAGAARDEHKAVVELIAELERELSLVGTTNEQQRISNELHHAGAAATEADKQKITELVTAIEAQEEAQQKLIDTMDTIRDAAGGALDAFAQSIQNSEGPLKALKAALQDILQTIIQIAERALIAQLFGAFGTAGGGFAAPALAFAGGGGRGRASAQTVNVNVTASPELNARIVRTASAAEQRAVSRGPAVARESSRRYAIP